MGKYFIKTTPRALKDLEQLQKSEPQAHKKFSRLIEDQVLTVTLITAKGHYQDR